MSEPPPEVVEVALETLAEELRRLYPHLEVRVHRPGQRLPPGAAQLPAVDELDREALRGRGADDRGRDHDPGDR